MPEFSFDHQQVGVAVITSFPKWYQGPLRSIKHSDKVRGDLALECLHKANEKGYIVVCSDGLSSKSFQSELKKIPHITSFIRKTTSSGNSKREVLRRIRKLEGIKVIVISEPEKVSIVTECIPLMVRPIFENKADVVVPTREKHLFEATYPEYMYRSETEANKLYNEALRADGIMKDTHPDFDHFFGPRAFRNDKKIVALFLKVYRFSDQSLISNFFDPDAYSNFIFFPVVNALQKKMRVLAVEVPFRYPTIQKENEEVGNREVFIAKRNYQRISILTDLMHFLSLLQNKRSSRLRPR